LDKGSIESDGLNMLQVDFANKVVGGGVLNRGSVQEEIRFCINTELIISRLFTQELLDEEVLIIRGSENFNAYSGYGNQFEWERDRKDSTPIDDYGRRSTTIVAMDALSFTAHNKYTQYEKKYINRELKKAYCGFSENVPSNKTPIATGNWGCGAFNGDKSLKALIQLMVASECGRGLVYFTFGDSSLKRDLENFYSFISERNFTVGQLYKALEYYDKEVTYSYKKIDLFDFIRNSKNKIY
jgi:poly(ADP-ribose) glycohydrolase